jgi:ATP/maltotriose-dependent transcriptional regulator MalT
LRPGTTLGLNRVRRRASSSFSQESRVTLFIVMTMSLSSDGGFDANFWSDSQTPHRSSTESTPRPRTVLLPLIEAKLRLPNAKKGIRRTKLLELLERSARNHAGTLMVGRAGSGKTTLAADFARRIPSVGWNSIDAGDSDWAVFSRYFQAMVLGREFDDQERDGSDVPQQRTPLEMFAELLTNLEARSREWPKLLVLDGVDHLFDSEWFNEFFDMMMASVPPDVHILVLSRTKPPNPLWRLRSKQVINVMDEKLLAFSLPETEKLFALHGRRGRRAAASAHQECYGRPGKLVRFLEADGRVAQNRER